MTPSPESSPIDHEGKSVQSASPTVSLAAQALVKRDHDPPRQAQQAQMAPSDSTSIDIGQLLTPAPGPPESAEGGDSDSEDDPDAPQCSGLVAPLPHPSFNPHTNLAPTPRPSPRLAT